jgi:uncharacterized protein (TIGR02145 family)
MSQNQNCIDIDGNIYRTVKIGNQVWTVENLKVTKYRNGDAILYVIDNLEWAKLTIGAYCNYDNDMNNIMVYGRLYNWYAINDSRNIAPTGWHVPTDEEWKQLEIVLGMSRSTADETEWRGSDVGGKLKEAGKTYWSSPNTGATNESGFSALPGGFRGVDNSNYYSMNLHAYFWSFTEYNVSVAWSRHLSYHNSDITRDGNDKRYGFSVRLIKD